MIRTRRRLCASARSKNAMHTSRLAPWHAIVALTLLVGPGALAFADTALPPGDPANGKKLLATYCVECHDSSVYTRRDRRVNSLPQLIGQVEACSRLPKQPLTRAEVNDLIVYLNQAYYRFK
jgi:hypothetical protein